MRYLIDTHVFIGLLIDQGIPPYIKEIIKDRKYIKYISIVSLWEIVIKQNLNKLKLDYNIDEMLDEINDSSINVLQIEYRYLEVYSHLPLIHRDPFDRLLISTALADGMTIITSDEDIQKYEIDWIF